MRNLLQDHLALTGLGILIIITIITFLPELFVFNDPLQINLSLKMQDYSSQFPLGTDPLGRCLYSRLLLGTSNTLKGSLTVLAISAALGTAVGCAAGLAGGIVDRMLMRLVDALLAFPAIVLAVTIAGLLGPSYKNLVLALSAVAWVSYARIIRGSVLKIKNQEYILAAICSGTGSSALLIRHIIPGILPQIAVMATNDLGSIIMSISGLSFLGMGIQPPYPELGIMIRDYWPYFMTSPWLVLYPGTILVLIVFAFNTVGDGLSNIGDIREVREK